RVTDAWFTRRGPSGGSSICRRCLAFLVLLSANPQTFSNHDQIGQRFGAHFSHDVAAVNLYCPFAYADLACDLLVHKAAGHERHNLALARGANLARASEFDFSSARHFRSRSSAPVTASSISCSRTGLIKKSIAPAFMALTDIGTSP